MTAPPKVENFRLQAALDYAARGWRVFPVHDMRFSVNAAKCSCGRSDCGSPGKHPRTLHGLADASSDPEQLRRWWSDWPTANVAITTGHGSGFIAIDVDPRHGGNEALAALAEKHGPMPVTVEAETGGGGSHLLFAHPGVKVSTVKSTPDHPGRLPAGLDVKGDGGYIVAAPSNHESGNRYAWAIERGPDDVAIAPVPAWLLPLIVEPKRERPAVQVETEGIGAAYWLGKALKLARTGKRNDIGFDLACQLRDNRIPEREAERVMLGYQAAVPQSEKPYTVKEALDSCRQAYQKPPRDPAGRDPVKPIAKAKAPTFGGSAKAVSVPGAADELRQHLEAVRAGTFYNLPFPWQTLTTLTQALIPGTITVLCGDPGVGKTFLILDMMRFWLGYLGCDKPETGPDPRPSAFFIEKNRVFYSRRLLAQLAGDSRFVDFEWLKQEANAATIRRAMDSHADEINSIGSCVWTSPKERVTLESLLVWIQQQAEVGRRVIVVDPITAIAAGVDRWTKDDDFVIAAQAACVEHNCSLILTTHPAKTTKGPASGHNAAGGSAYFRFADVLMWLRKYPQPRRVEYMTPCGKSSGTYNLFLELIKTRDGRGSGLELAYKFEEMRFSEGGVVLRELKDRQGDEAAAA